MTEPAVRQRRPTTARLLRHLLREVSVTQRELARRAGVHGNTVWNWLAGESRIGLDETARLAALVGYEVYVELRPILGYEHPEHLRPRRFGGTVETDD